MVGANFSVRPVLESIHCFWILNILERHIEACHTHDSGLQLESLIFKVKQSYGTLRHMLTLWVFVIIRD